ncbi:MAG TPA: hypothetical protein VGX48_07685 [Pyrinomonadaceae bacterium]|jgi:hypothetical protein|nr:hypothetical protein [Pyrinomonadaceae bacterium]
MRRVLLLLMMLCLPASADAKWGYAPLAELVRDSDLIVVGTLGDVSEQTADGMDYAQGHIRVREVIWGDASPGDALLLKWSNPSDLVCPRVKHENTAGREGIWLLTSNGYAVRADYPGRFVALDSRPEVEAALGPRRAAPGRVVNYNRKFKAKYYIAFGPPARRGPAPIVRAGLTALVFLILFPVFRRLRAALIGARLARVTHGAQTWQI